MYLCTKSTSCSDAAKAKETFPHAYDRNLVTCSIKFRYIGWSALQSGKEKEEVCRRAAKI